MCASTGIVREFPPGLVVFMENKGMELLLHCLIYDYEKVNIKALFLLSNISSNISSHITGTVYVCVCVHAVHMCVHVRMLVHHFVCVYCHSS